MSEPDERGCSAVPWYGTKSKLTFCPLGMPQSTKKMKCLEAALNQRYSCHKQMQGEKNVLVKDSI